MEAQEFEELEAVEQVETEGIEKEVELKEYEKLLLAEKHREIHDKAINLIKFGCFNQVTETTVDFSRYNRIDGGKKYKGLYKLYQNMDTEELVFILPLVENNKGDVEEKTNMKPYAYDCIKLESMDDETYQQVAKAAKNNIRSYISALVTTAWIVFFTVVVLGIVLYVYSAIKYSLDKYDWDVCIFSALSQCAALIAGETITLPLLVLMSIKYKKYKEQ